MAKEPLDLVLRELMNDYEECYQAVLRTSAEMARTKLAMTDYSKLLEELGAEMRGRQPGIPLSRGNPRFRLDFN